MNTIRLSLLTIVMGLGTAAQAADMCTPSRMLILVDKSSSMTTGFVGSDTKWTVARGALNQVTGAYSDKIELGLALFPGQGGECSTGTTVVSPARGTHDAIMTALAEPPPEAGNWTPMAESLEAVLNDPSMQASARNRYVLLLTDGWQYCAPFDSATRFDPVDAVQALKAAGITTYVVGFGASVDPLTLGRAAAAAGTALPGCDPNASDPAAEVVCYYRAESPASLVEALNAISLQVSQEVCDGVDNNCDGQVDEGCLCVTGATQSCGMAVGTCTEGTQTCDASGQWGECTGAVGPTAETCDGQDNDCDGQADEDDAASPLCEPGSHCEAGACTPDAKPMAPAMDTSGCSTGNLGSGSAVGSVLFLMVLLAFRRRR